MKIGIVIVNYNGAKYQNECIESILASSYKDYSIIVVDNASKDNSMELLDEFHDERIVKVYSKENLGVASGNNLGIIKAYELGSDAILLLNNDTVLNVDTLELMAKELENGNDIVSPLIFYWQDKSKIWYAGGKFNRLKGMSYHLFLKETYGGQPIPDLCDYAPTCCLLIRREVFDKVGFMDPAYFMYFDDTDFCIRCHLMGYRIKLAKNASIYHKVSLSTGGENSKLSTYYVNRNRFYFLKRYRRNFSVFAYQFTYWSRKLKYLKSLFTKSNNRYIKKAYKDFKHNRMGRCDSL